MTNSKVEEYILPAPEPYPINEEIIIQQALGSQPQNIQAATGAIYTTASGLAPVSSASTDIVIYGGSTFENRGTAPFRVTQAGAMTATNATITGTITATAGTIGGFTITATTIATTNLTLTSGAANTANITVGTGSNAGGINSANASGDIIFWGGSTFANRATAAFNVTAAGAVSCSNITITGGSISSTPISSIPNNSSTDISLLEFTQNLAFTSNSATQVNWGSGTIVLSNGRSFSISAGNTGTMSALTYIYLDTGASSTVLQTTTTYSTAMGANKILIAVAQNNAVGASVITYGGGQPILDGVGNIAAASITTATIAANTIVGSNINTLNISGKNATFDTGTIGGFTMSSTTLSATNFKVVSGAANTARVEVGTGSNVAGINSVNAGSDIAFWSGATFANRTTAPFRVDGAGNLTATSATISGYLVNTAGTFGGSGTDGALSITSGTTTLSLASGATFVKNYTSISITSTGTLAFSGANSAGTVIVLKSQGAVTLTSSSAPMIDASGMGATGGNAATNGTDSASIFDASGTHGGGGGGNAPATSTPGTGGTGGAIYTAKGAYGKTSTSVFFKSIWVGCGSGGGGGGAGRDSNGSSGTGGVGGAGGGAIYIECAGALNFTTTNGISVAGLVGANGTQSVGGGTAGGGGGGGGAGGMVLILYKTLTANTGSINTVAGNGGSGGGAISSTNSASGGGGGAGGGYYYGAGGAGGNGTTAGNGVAGGAGSQGAGGGGGGGAGMGGNQVQTGGAGGTGGSSDNLFVTQNTVFA